MENNSDRKVIKWLLLVMGVLGVIVAILVIYPGKTGIQKTENESVIDMMASRRWVIANGDCVTLTWQVDNISALYINGQGQVGVGSDVVCVDNGFKTIDIEVQHIDDTATEYALTVGTLALAPEIWALGLTIFTLGSITLYILLVQPVMHRWKNTISPTLRWIGIVLVNLLVVFIISEIGVRFYFLNYGEEEDRERYIYSLEQIRERNQFIVLPFVNYSIDLNEANNLGYRNEEDTIVPKPDDVYRIIAYGGSATYGIGVVDSLTYPAQLQRILRDDYGYTDVEVLNAGANGYNSWNSTVNFAFRGLEVEPDLVIIYHGANETGTRLSDPECFRGNNIHRGLPPGEGVLQWQSQVISPSALHRFLGINWEWLEDPVEVDSSLEKVIECDEPVLDEMQLIETNPAIYYERNLTSIIGLADIRDIDVMLSTYIYDSRIPDDIGPDWWKTALADTNDAVRNVAEDYDTLFFDLTLTDMPDIPEYWFGDYQHLSIEGLERQAQYYADYLVETGILDQE